MRGSLGYQIILLFSILGNVLFAQEEIPVAVPDSSFPIVQFSPTFDSVSINLLLNDFDPLGQGLEMHDFLPQGSTTLDYAVSDSGVTILTTSFFMAGLSEQVFHYRVRRVTDTTAISNWAHLYINAAQDPEFPVALNDTVTGIPGYPIYVNVLRNDYHPLGDSIFIIEGTSMGSLIGDSVLKIDIWPFIQQPAKDYYYIISDTAAFIERFDAGAIHVIIEHRDFYDSLEINNINARFNCFGNHFWDFDSYNQFIVPRKGRASSIWSNSFWIGGLDPQNDLHLAGERYRQVGKDFWHGPVSDVYDSAYDLRWFHVWNLSRTDIEYHKANWWQPGYEPIDDIATWPGNGDPDLGQAAIIAPFDDSNKNGIYEPMQGDVPRIKGDQALFFVFNDAREYHWETGGLPLGIEVRAMAYAFDAPEDSTLWNTVFLHYDILNRTDTAYHDVYMGTFTDFELGYGWDDRVECDVENGMYFTYNGIEVDGTPDDPAAYGAHPPAQGVVLLGGAQLEPDGLDNPRYDISGNQIVDYSINGLNFGDGIVDNERLGMTHFIYFNSGGANWPSDPYYAIEYYTYMQSIWKDGTKLQYGGYGHPTAGSVGPDCNFIWPRDSDPFNWGTGGLLPNGGYNQDGLFWTAEHVGMLPTFVRGLGSSGPFNLAPGQIQSLDLAFPWARDYQDSAWSSALLLKERVAYLKEKFQNDTAFFSRVETQSRNQSCQIFPNPVGASCRMEFTQFVENGIFTVYDVVGNRKLSGSFHQSKTVDVTTSSLSRGIYFLRVETEGRNFHAKFIKD